MHTHPADREPAWMEFYQRAQALGAFKAGQGVQLPVSPQEGDRSASLQRLPVAGFLESRALLVG